jgi:CRISPR-associated protein Csd1
MILQALKEYYDRKAADPEGGIAPRGWFRGKIDFVIVLNHEGKFERLDCEQTIKDGKRLSHPCLLPYIGKQALKHTMSGKDANLLWDNATFVLGLGKNGSTKLASFSTTINERLGNLNDPAIKAVLRFLEDGQRDSATFSPVIQHSEYGEEIGEGRVSLTFQFLGDSHRFVFLRPGIKARVSEAIEPSEQTGTCLVTGTENEQIELCHLVIKNLYGARKDPNLVSFNQPAFNSFGKDQSANAPVSKAAAFAYTTALNYLTARDSRQRLQAGDSTVVFWSARDTELETRISDFFSEPPKDDPDRGVRAVASLFKAVETGAFVRDEGKTMFFVLGMAPFGPRIAVRLWIVDTVAGMAGKICRHFEDTRIAHGPRDKDTLSLFRLLVSTATQGKSENISPNIGGDVMRAILEGLPYPQTLLQAAIRRIRAEHDITYPRASIIKACLNRSTRFNNPKQKEELHVTLDMTNINIGYRLGRLFATLERIQSRKFTQTGGKEPNSTIRDKYYGSASGTPVAVFGTLIRLSKHHLANLENAGERINFEKLLGEIMCGINDFPPHLQLDDQGRFAIGYYHQMHDFFTKKNDSQPPKGN